jgi:hypothetical protein
MSPFDPTIRKRIQISLGIDEQGGGLGVGERGDDVVGDACC